MNMGNGKKSPQENETVTRLADAINLLGAWTEGGQYHKVPIPEDKAFAMFADLGRVRTNLEIVRNVIIERDRLDRAAEDMKELHKEEVAQVEATLGTYPHTTRERVVEARFDSVWKRINALEQKIDDLYENDLAMENLGPEAPRAPWWAIDVADIRGRIDGQMEARMRRLENMVGLRGRGGCR